MIVFDLKCDSNHVFEAWFASSQAYADQQDARRIACPVCGDTLIVKAAMAPNIAAKGNARTGNGPDVGAKRALQALAVAQAGALERSQWVGADFADRARAMHVGEEPACGIHGQASIADARALLAEGVAIVPLMLPVVPPEALN